MCRIRCLGTSRTRPHAANQGERHRLALTAISLRAARLRAARTQQTLRLARCLRVGADEFRALDKVAAVQLEGAPTFRLLHQPLGQGVQPRVGGLATGSRPGPPPPRVPGVRRDPVEPSEEIDAILGADDPELVRRYFELHRERLDERLADQRRALARLEQLLAARLIGAATRSQEKEVAGR